MAPELPFRTSPSDEDEAEEQPEGRLQGTRRSVMKAAGAGAGALAVGGTLVGSASAAIGDSYYQVDLIETTNDSVITPLTSSGYSDNGNLIDWKWGDAAGNTAEGSMNKTSYDGDLGCTVDSTSNFSFNLGNSPPDASVDVSTTNCSNGINLTLVCYAAPDDAGLGWTPSEASKQVEFAQATTTVSSDTTTTISTEIPARDIDKGLIGYWSFETENISSSTVYDASGNGFHGTENEGSGTIDYTQNPSGQNAGPSAEFDNSNEETILIDDPGQDPESYTVSCWMKTTTSPDYYAFLAKSGSFWCGTANENSTLVARTHPSDGASGGPTAGSSDIADGSWHHIVYVVDKAADQTQIYVDNTVDATGGYNFGSSSDQVGIASKSDESDYFTGELAEIRWYNRALSASEVDTLYQQG